jgi:hypothetical protein
MTKNKKVRQIKFKVDTQKHEFVTVELIVSHANIKIITKDGEDNIIKHQIISNN